MTEAIAVKNDQQIHRQEFNPADVDLIKRTIAKGTNDDELALFIQQCKRTGLDPFSKQIYAIMRWDGTAKREVMGIQTSIDGFRLIAERSGKYDGQEGPFWCGEDGMWRDVWLSKDYPAAAKVITHKGGASHGFVGVATWEEYAQTKKNGGLTMMWQKMPATMLAKCAESLALRKAFPAEMSGIYTSEEMGQADNAPTRTASAPISEPQSVKSAHKAAHGDPDPFADMGDSETHITGIPEEVQVKTGTKNGKKWTRYGIKVGGKWFNTFSGSFGLDAEKAQKMDAPVTIAYTTNDKGYHDIDKLTANEADVVEAEVVDDGPPEY